MEGGHDKEVKEVTMKISQEMEDICEKEGFRFKEMVMTRNPLG